MQTVAFPSRMEREAFKQTAIKAAQAAGEILKDCASNGFIVQHKSTIDLVTDADRMAEQTIVEIIADSYPDHHVLGEEGGCKKVGDSLYCWIVDPLDGTTNFAHGLPLYCVSIGLEYRGHIILGVVWDPNSEELFVGEIGCGATLNSHAIKVSRINDLNEALIATGFAYDIRKSDTNNLNHFARFSMRALSVRRLGAAVLDLCYVASGRFDGFWELKLSPWDIAAGSLIVREAGGHVTDFSGTSFSIYGKQLVASNGLIHDQMLAVLKQI
jgi:myo-inositol-1(or 4)-monophosphatase